VVRKTVALLQVTIADYAFSGFTALHEAVYNRKVANVRLLVAAGANVECQDVRHGPKRHPFIKYTHTSHHNCT
jgi:hypothetical protein